MHEFTHAFREHDAPVLDAMSWPSA